VLAPGAWCLAKIVQASPNSCCAGYPACYHQSCQHEDRPTGGESEEEMETLIITVLADETLDDCLQGAVDAYVAQHPDLAGWDLSPRWTDNDTRETVDLTVPDWAV
jgi:hypothetical protein